MGFDDALKEYLAKASQKELNENWEELKDYCNYGSILIDDDENRCELYMNTDMFECKHNQAQYEQDGFIQAA